MYQGSELSHFTDTTIKTCQNEAIADLRSFDNEMRARLEWSDIGLMQSVLFFF